MKWEFNGYGNFNGNMEMERDKVEYRIRYDKVLFYKILFYLKFKTKIIFKYNDFISQIKLI